MKRLHAAVGALSAACVLIDYAHGDRGWPMVFRSILAAFLLRNAFPEERP